VTTYVCRNGHTVSAMFRGVKDCWRCRYNEKRKLLKEMPPFVSLPGEEWHAVPGSDIYEVSNLGRVRTIRFRNRRADFPWIKLKVPRILSSGYPAVKLDLDGHHKNVAVHVLVLKAFRGPPPPGHECAHLNGIRNDPRLENLAWVTRKENLSHMILHGTVQRGEKNWRASLTDKQAAEIRERFAAGATRKEIAEAFGASYAVVCGVIQRKTWKHI